MTPTDFQSPEYDPAIDVDQHWKEYVNMNRKVEDNESLDRLVPRESKYLSKDDVGNGMVLTIRGYRREMVKGDDGEDERTAVHWVESGVKPMLLNRTNSLLIMSVLGASTTGETKGKKILVYNDPTVIFGSRVVGGLRIRSAEGQNLPLSAAPKQEDFDDGDEIPF